jgi:hypothetical protein
MKTGPKRRTKEQVLASLFKNARTEGECIIPLKKPMPSGYVQVLVFGYYDYAHRFVYEQITGKNADGLVVRHSCHNKSCINPDHLSLGTHADNVNDKVVAGRHPHGVTHYKNKLTEAQVRLIKADTQHTYAELSHMFGISRGGIHNIKTGKSWKHI